MSDLSMQLPERLSRLGETGLLIPLLRLLADGDPVTVQQLSVAAGRTIDEVRLGLAAMQDTEYDDQGRIGLFIDEGVGHVARSGGASVWG
ncbi:hypothetical protein [Kytococcus sp. Marseille-QA3725]